MNTSTILVILYIIFLGFMIANWMNKPRNKK